MPDSEPRVIVADGVELPLDPAAERANENIGRRILVGGAWRTISYGLSTLVAVAATSIISRSIGPVDFAQFATALSLIAVAMLISDFGLLALGVREYAALTGDARVRAFRAMITLRFVFGLISATAIVLFALLAGYSRGLVVGLCFAGLAVPTVSLASSYCVPLQASYRLNLLAGFDFMRQVLTSSSMVAAALATGSVGVIIATNLPVALVLAVVAGLLVFREVSLIPSLDFAAMRGLLRDVGTFAVAASVGTMYPFIAQVVSNSALGAYESGQFALAFRVYAVLLSGWIVVVSGAFPLLVTSSREDIQRMIFAARRLVQASVLAGAFGTAGLVAGAGFVVAVLGGDEYRDATELIAVIALALPATFTLITGNSVLLASGRHRELITVSVTGAIASILLTWAASSAWGGTGAALGIVAGELLLASGYAWMVAKIDRRALPRAPWLLRVALAAALGASAALLPLPSLVAAAIGGAVYVAVGLLLRIFPPEVTDRIPLIGTTPAGSQG